MDSGNPEPSEAMRPHRRKGWIVLAVILIAGVAAVLSYSNYYGLLSDGAGPSCSTIRNTNPPGQENSTAPASGEAVFLIVEADPGSPYEGLNGSAYHLGLSWPVMLVHEGQTVVIHVINCASSESHGFAITHYFDAGVALGPGRSYTLTFVADQKGSFRVFCSIFCAIHPLMQDGELVVT